MSVFPHTQLLFESSLVVAISGPHIQILDSRTGDLIVSTTERQGADKDSLLKSGPVRLAAVDKDGKHLVTSGDDKLFKLWQIDGLKLLNERELPKKPTALAFTRDGQTILSADKFGDIFSYGLHPASAPQNVEQKKSSLASHENPSGGKLILGHTSFLTAFLLSPDEKFIVTADRDEHIRVSWYPQGYTIEMYCLGHERFVSAIHIPAFSPTELVSGGGDPMLKIWDWMSGKVKREIPILHAVEPFIKVKPAKRTFRRFEDGDEMNEDEAPKKGRKAKARARQKAKQDSAEASTSTPELPAEPSDTVDSTEASGADDTVFALRRIDSLDAEGSRHLVFSAVGATALFSCIYSEEVETEVHAFDFDKPVIDFTVASDGLIWVCLDAQWSQTGVESTDTTPTMVRVVQLSGERLVEVSADSLPLISSLNSKCLLPATPTELNALELYLPLSALPKNNEAEHDPMDREPFENPGDGKEVSKKELGRLKSKKAVAKVQTTRPAGEEELEERSTKRAKSEHEEDAGDVGLGDVAMDEA
ncbi:tRNA (guanine-N(7)-)-methyltransferase non-catalytic subunit TRM82 [Mycena sanguinolenta]|uniref:tRNA (Guanine-N(7)-)-methyltransferase non-catalytic subunit TRM82 n=1 Tax=Mycena sanguinolenta TaxID=230812 RepID=A0A8H6Z4G4_9AGAR|nr:tRNA (guanine-N(7)-)-methyltransferase non-catalytic subunit TRM82 [Mycena sanguinolenta]